LGKPTLECRVSFDVFAVFGKGGSANATKLSAGQERFEEVASVHPSAFRASTSHDEMKFIDKEDNSWSTVLRSLLDLVQYGLDTLLVLSLVFGSSHERTHVEGPQPGNERGRDIALDDSLGKSFCNSSFTNAGLTDEDGVVLGPKDTSVRARSLT
jgi:hypothetical protein